ncbi:MAG: HAD family hydrolase, partial [Candidatus Paceibacterota bacterium]
LKPDPRAFLFVLEQLGVDPRQAAMVGDEIGRDLVPAIGLGMKAFLIDREDKDTSVLPDGIIKINSLKKLGEYIR